MDTKYENETKIYNISESENTSVINITTLEEPGRFLTFSDFIMPVAAFVSLFGNSLSLIIFRRESFSRMSSTIFLSSLAVFDILSIWNSFIFNFLSVQLSGKSLEMLYEVPCRLYYYLIVYFQTCGAWLRVELALERAVIVLCPLKSRVICTKKRAVIGTVTLLVLISMVSLWMPFTSVLENGKCIFKPSYDKSVFIFLQDFKTLLYGAFPASVLIVLNGIIVASLVLSNKKSKALFVNDGSIKNKNSSNLSKKTFRITTMIVVTTLLYIVLSAPGTIVFLVYGEAFLPASHDGSVFLGIMWEIYRTATYINHSINFVFYGICADKYRDEAKKLLVCDTKPSRVVLNLKQESVSAWSCGLPKWNSGLSLNIGEYKLRKSIQNT